MDMKLFETLLISLLFSGSDSSLSFNYERLQMLGSGRRHIPPFAKFQLHREAFPEPLPQPKSKTQPVVAPYHNLYQGRRREQEKRVFRERFNLVGQPQGQHVSFEGSFDCPLTYLSVETESNIPIVLRGGVGHTYFSIIIKAKPYDGLAGQVRAYCLKTDQDYYREKQTPNVAKLFLFTQAVRMPD